MLDDLIKKGDSLKTKLASKRHDRLLQFTTIESCKQKIKSIEVEIDNLEIELNKVEYESQKEAKV